MPRPNKVAKVEEAKALIGDNMITIIADYRGLDVSEVTELRAKLREAEGTTCKVIKNTFFKIACNENSVECTEGLLAGPSMFVFSKTDPVFPAKVLVDYAKTNSALEIKGGILDNKELSADEIKVLASMPSREELLAKLVYMLNYPLQGLVNVLSGPTRGLVTALDAIAKQKEN